MFQNCCCCYSVAQLCLTLRLHGLHQASLPSHARLPCFSLYPRVCANSCPLSQWCHPTILFSVDPFSCPQPVFSSELGLNIRWPKYWSFSISISPPNEYSGLISFRIDWLDLLAVQGTLEFSLAPQFKSIDSLALSFLYSPILTPIHDYWKNHSLG